MQLELQPKLLRVLQEREFEAVGSTRTTRVDVRVVAATNQDLKQMVRDREFREDLYYRLNVFPIYLPPLRERKTDIPELVEHFVQQFADSMDKTIETIPEESMRALVRHHWPGNIRELQNYIARGVILSNDGIFEPAPLESYQPLEPEISNPTLEDKVRGEILAACQRRSARSSRPTRVEAHHTVLQDEAPWYSATPGPLAGLKSCFPWRRISYMAKTISGSALLSGESGRGCCRIIKFASDIGSLHAQNSEISQWPSRLQTQRPN